MRITSRFLVAALGSFACVGVFAPVASAIADTTAPTVPHFATGSASAANAAPSVAIDFGVSSDPRVARQLTSGIRDYVINRSDRVDPVAYVPSIVTHRIVDRGVRAGTEYVYTVRARDWANNYSEPAVVTVQTNGTSLAFSPFHVLQPTAVTASAKSATEVLLAISAPTHKVAKYLLYRGTSPIPVAVINGRYGTGSSSTTQYVDKGRTPSTSYDYTIRSVDDRGALGVPVTASATTPAAAPKKCQVYVYGTCLAWG